MPMETRFFDLQVNGYAGADFNGDDLSAEAVHTACQRLRDDGVGGILATIITDEAERMAARLRRLVRLREADPLVAEVIVGFHIEGPFLNETPGYRGAHPPQAIRPADLDVMRRLLDAAEGLTRLVTLAPERDAGLQVTRFLVSAGITVAAGHCNPSLEQLEAAISEGLSMFTHLGNGCPVELPRHDNVVQRVLSLADRLWISFIADGVHVPFFALRNYLKVASLERCVIVTDAIAPAGLGPGRYTLGWLTLQIGADMVARLPGTDQLAGSAITMPASLANLRERLGLTDEQARRLTWINPRRAIGLE